MLCLASESRVVQHLGTELVSRSMDLAKLDLAVAVSMFDVLCSLAKDSWHPHLADIFIILANPDNPALRELADQIFVFLWDLWLNSSDKYSSEIVPVLNSVLQLLNPESEAPVAAAVQLGEWFTGPGHSKSCLVVLKTALMLLGQFAVMRTQVFNFIPSCHALLALGEHKLILPIIEMFLLFIQTQSFAEVPGGYQMLKVVCDSIPGDYLPQMLILAAGFVQVGAEDVLDFVAFTARCLGLPDEPVRSAAMIVIWSAIMVSPFRPGLLDLVLGQFDRSQWYDFGAQQETLAFSRLALMSLGAFMVLAIRGEDGAEGRVYRQFGRLESHDARSQVEDIETLTLPYDKICVEMLWACFQVIRSEPTGLLSGEDIFFAVSTPGRLSEEPVGFFDYLRRFNAWFPQGGILNPGQSHVARESGLGLG